MNVCENEIRDAVEAELVAANEKHPPFASIDESGCAVCGAFKEVELESTQIKKLISELVVCIGARDNQGVLLRIARAKYAGIRLAIEASKATAMAIKAEQSITDKMDLEE